MIFLRAVSRIKDDINERLSSNLSWIYNIYLQFILINLLLSISAVLFRCLIKTAASTYTPLDTATHVEAS